MRIKQHLLICFLPVIAVLCFVFLSPSFADFRKVNECELARASASLTGQPAETRRPTSADEELECTEHDKYASIPAEGEPSTNGGGFFSIHNDYGYDWLQNMKVVGDWYYQSPAASSPVTVEAGTDNTGPYAPYGATYIRIGLGSQEVGLDSMDINVTLGSKAASIAGQDQILGSLHLDGLKVKSNATSYVTLYKTNNEMGLGVTLDTTIDRVSLDTLSWGDSDGFPNAACPGACNTSNAGYVGLKDTNIFGVTISGGPISLEVGTDYVGGKQELSITKYVHMGINNLNVGLASLDTTVVVGNKKDFSGTKYVLGTFYMKDLAMNVGGYLDIYNLADKNVATGLDFSLNVSELTLDTLAWGDPDGIPATNSLSLSIAPVSPAYTSAGYVGLRSLGIYKLAITGLATIETVTVQSGDAGIDLLPVGTVFVRIGFSKLDVGMDSLNANVALGNRKNNLDQVLGSVYLGGLDMNIDGSLKIHTPSASTQGIVLDLDVNFSKLNLNFLSWGDADGVGGKTSAGFRGRRSININALTIAGKLSIDVATVNTTVTSCSADEMMYALYETHNVSPSFVHLGIGTGNANSDPTSAGALEIGIASVSWDLVMDNYRSLNSTHASILRSFFISDMTAKVNGWVNIGAH